jgi:ribosome-binding factor A
MKSFERREKVARAIQRELAAFIQQGGVKDDRLDKFISIIGVDLNPSLSSAKVLYSVMDNGHNDAIISKTGTQAALDDNAGYLRGVVARKLNLKYAPRLIFEASDSLSRAVDMVDLINRTVRADNQKKELRGNSLEAND